MTEPLYPAQTNICIILWVSKISKLKVAIIKKRERAQVASTGRFCRNCSPVTKQSLYGCEVLATLLLYTNEIFGNKDAKICNYNLIIYLQDLMKPMLVLSLLWSWGLHGTPHLLVPISQMMGGQAHINTPVLHSSRDKIRASCLWSSPRHAN